MRRGLAWLAGALGFAAFWRYLRDEAAREPERAPVGDPAAELRARLEQARGAADDRDEFDAAEGQPVDEVEPREPEPVAEAEPVAEPEPEAEPEPQAGPETPVETRSLEERRRAIHEKAQQALGEMGNPPD